MISFVIEGAGYQSALIRSHSLADTVHVTHNPINHHRSTLLSECKLIFHSRRVPGRSHHRMSENHWSLLDRPWNKHHLSSSVIYQISDGVMQVTNTLNLTSFVNQNSNDTQHKTCQSQSSIELGALPSHSLNQHDEVNGNISSHDECVKPPNAADAKIFPWMKETRSKQKQTG